MNGTEQEAKVGAMTFDEAMVQAMRKVDGKWKALRSLLADPKQLNDESKEVKNAAREMNDAVVDVFTLKNVRAEYVQE